MAIVFSSEFGRDIRKKEEIIPQIRDYLGEIPNIVTLLGRLQRILKLDSSHTRSGVRPFSHLTRAAPMPSRQINQTFVNSYCYLAEHDEIQNYNLPLLNCAQSTLHGATTNLQELSWLPGRMLDLLAALILVAGRLALFKTYSAVLGQAAINTNTRAYSVQYKSIPISEAAESFRIGFPHTLFAPVTPTINPALFDRLYLLQILHEEHNFPLQQILLKQGLRECWSDQFSLT
jgi:hypothetical protein